MSRVVCVTCSGGGRRGCSHSPAQSVLAKMSCQDSTVFALFSFLFCLSCFFVCAERQQSFTIVYFPLYSSLHLSYSPLFFFCLCHSSTSPLPVKLMTVRFTDWPSCQGVFSHLSVMACIISGRALMTHGDSFMAAKVGDKPVTDFSCFSLRMFRGLARPSPVRGSSQAGEAKVWGIE